MIGLHHVQVVCPPGGEDAVRPFWRALGLHEVPKPAALAGRGGCWFRAPEGGAEIHAGVEDPFLPACKAHPALLVTDVDEVADRLRAAGFDVDESERETFEGHLRFHAFDPHGNRIEVLSVRTTRT